MLTFQAISVDCHDTDRVATFWEQALGWRRTYNSTEEVVLEPPAGSPADGVSPDILFLQVPDEKVVKNRLHFDLRPQDQAYEVERLIGLGAKRVDIGQGEQQWVVLADPEGNEFCVLRAYQTDSTED